MPPPTWDRWKFRECEISFVSIPPSCLSSIITTLRPFFLLANPKIFHIFFCLTIVISVYSFTVPRIENTMIWQQSSSIHRCPTNTLWFVQERNFFNFVLLFHILIFLWQDDAIRNLFSANTFHEYSAQSLVIFLVLLLSFCSIMHS